jgi:uncharacterized protein (DUF885 family)
MLATPIEKSPFWSAIDRMPASFGAADRERLTAAYRKAIGDRSIRATACGRLLRDTYLPHRDRGAGTLGDEGWRRALRRTNWRAHDHHEAEPRTRSTRSACPRSRVSARRWRRPRSGRISRAISAPSSTISGPIRFYCKTPEELLGRFKTIEARIWNRIPKLFRVGPRHRSGAPLPALGEQRGTGYYRAGPPDGKRRACSSSTWRCSTPARSPRSRL